ncbi:predicted protein [Naegleria gruberi]|uniref:Predicted protein n=1 Tax=Naegleria gruberi TaxID=5762 RepID=D2VAP4_NAEGR|nr:uncharacterized protein NAEGRDRAFT_65927 [Naegleria gruberi]EFC46112.1 predicted protein [Naegleria gruberi]|eukprot:XP_002678856.1 predicted protein [Naegleria gruberi strain NEG-M]
MQQANLPLIKDEHFAKLTLKSNRCPVCHKKNVTCPHTKALSERTNLPSPLIASENARIYSHPIPTDRSAEFDEFIIQQLENFTRRVGNRDYSGAKDLYKKRLIDEFYNVVMVKAKKMNVISDANTNQGRGQPVNDQRRTSTSGTSYTSRIPLNPVNPNIRPDVTGPTSNGISKQHKTVTNSLIKKASPVKKPIEQSCQISLTNQGRRNLVKMTETDFASLQNLMIAMKRHLLLDENAKFTRIRIKNAYTDKLCSVYGSETLKPFREDFFGKVKCMEIKVEAE